MDSKPVVPLGRVDATVEPERQAENRLTDIRAGRHPRFVSIVFELTGPIDAHGFQVDGRTLRFTLGHTRTALKPFHTFDQLDAWVRIQEEGSNITVSLGLPPHTGRRRTLFLKDPYRLVFNLYEPGEKSPASVKEAKKDFFPYSTGGKSVVKALPSTSDIPIPGGVDQVVKDPSPPVGETANTGKGDAQVYNFKQMDMMEARILSRQGFYERSLLVYEKLRKRYPDDEEIWEDFIETLVNYEAYELALMEIRNILLKNPSNLRAQRIQARVYQELNQPQWNFPIFEGLLDDYETDVGIWSDYGFSRLDAGDWSGALNYYCRVLELDPDNESALRSVHEILRKHRPQLVPDFMSYYQEGDDSLIQTYSLAHARDLGRRTRLNVDYQEVHIRRPDQPSRGYGRVHENLHDMTAVLRHRLGSRWQVDTGGSLYSGLGGGPSGFLAVDYEFPRRGGLRGSYVYYRPWYDPVEAAARQGNFNRARLSLNWNFDERWSLLAQGTQWDYFAQRWPKEDASRYGERHAFLGSLTRRLMARPALSASYSYYRSNFYYEDSRFRPIDMPESERIHALSFNLEDQACTYLGYGFSGGIRRDMVKESFSWFAFPFIKLRLGNRTDAALSYEFSSEANTPEGGENQAFHLSVRIIQ